MNLMTKLPMIRRETDNFVDFSNNEIAISLMEIESI